MKVFEIDDYDYDDGNKKKWLIGGGITILSLLSFCLCMRGVKTSSKASKLTLEHNPSDAMIGLCFGRTPTTPSIGLLHHYENLAKVITETSISLFEHISFAPECNVFFKLGPLALVNKKEILDAFFNKIKVDLYHPDLRIITLDTPSSFLYIFINRYLRSIDDMETFLCERGYDREEFALLLDFQIYTEDFKVLECFTRIRKFKCVHINNFTYVREFESYTFNPIISIGIFDIFVKHIDEAYPIEY